MHDTKSLFWIFGNWLMNTCISKPKEQKKNIFVTSRHSIQHRKRISWCAYNVLVTWKRTTIDRDRWLWLWFYKCSSVHWMHVVNFKFFGEFFRVRVLRLLLLLSCIPHAPSTNQLMPNMSANKHEIWRKIAKERHTREDRCIKCSNALNTK